MKPERVQQIEEIKKQTIGVEVEMNNITRKKAAQVAAEYFGTGRYENTAYRNGYSTWSAWDSQGREWKMQKDVSINGPDEEKCELVTPILTYDDIETLQEVLRRLRKAGAKSDATRGCGVHIHIGAQGHTPQSLRNLANIMAAREELIGKAIRIGHARTQCYCKVTDQAFLDRLNTKKPKTMRELEQVWYNNDRTTHTHYDNTRYHMLNLHATFTKGTVEFRLFNFKKPTANRRNGIHAGEIKAWIHLCLAMSAYAKKVRSASNKKPQIENEKFAMRTWMNILGLVGEEFSATREHLMKELDGDAAWRFGRPARTTSQETTEAEETA